MIAAVHARALAELAPEVGIRGVFSRDAARRAAFAAEFGVREAAGLEALLDDPDVDAILLLTPPNARRDIVAAAAARGKHVLCEKPLERTFTAARDIVEIAEGAGITFGVIFQHRFRAASRALKDLVASGDLGRIVTVQVTVPWWRPQSYYDQPGRGTYARDGGGVLISQAIHSLDLMLSIAGPVREVMAVAGTTALHRMESEDFVSAGLRFENGAIGALTATTAAYPGAAESIVIGFEGGTASLRGGILRVESSDGAVSEVGEPAGTGGGANPVAFPHAWHRDAIADFVAAVRDRRPPAVSGREALKVHALIAALIQSSDERRAVAPIQQAPATTP